MVDERRAKIAATQRANWAQRRTVQERADQLSLAFTIAGPILRDLAEKGDPTALAALDVLGQPIAVEAF
jgi:hypothetical protein